MTDPEKTAFRAALASDPNRMAEACWVIARAKVRKRGRKPQTLLPMQPGDSHDQA